MASIKLDFTEPAWPEINRENMIHTTEPIRVTALPGGMASGAPSVALCIELPDGQFVVAETSLQLFLTAADALKAKYGDPRK